MTEEPRSPVKEAWGMFEAYVNEFEYIDKRSPGCPKCVAFNSNVRRALESLRDALRPSKEGIW